MGTRAGKRNERMNRKLIVLRPVCDLQGRTQRMWSVLDPVLNKIEKEGTEIVLAERYHSWMILLWGEKEYFLLYVSMTPGSTWNTTGCLRASGSIRAV